MNYLLPTVEDRKYIFNAEQRQLLQTLQRDVQEWDSNEYLPPATLTWCQQQLREIGQELVGMPFNPEDPDPRLIGDTEAPYQGVYMALRKRALDHWDTRQDPKLDVCQKPIGAARWRPNVSEDSDVLES